LACAVSENELLKRINEDNMFGLQRDNKIRLVIIDCFIAKLL